jgi:hypothetical protein
VGFLPEEYDMLRRWRDLYSFLIILPTLPRDNVDLGSMANNDHLFAAISSFIATLWVNSHCSPSKNLFRRRLVLLKYRRKSPFCIFRMATEEDIVYDDALAVNNGSHESFAHREVQSLTKRFGRL